MAASTPGTAPTHESASTATSATNATTVTAVGSPWIEVLTQVSTTTSIISSDAAMRFMPSSLRSADATKRRRDRPWWQVRLWGTLPSEDSSFEVLFHL
jgi:hypothetical protein